MYKDFGIAANKSITKDIKMVFFSRDESIAMMDKTEWPVPKKIITITTKIYRPQDQPRHSQEINERNKCGAHIKLCST